MRVERRAAEILEAAAREAITTRSRHELHLRARLTSVLGGVGRCLDAHLLDRIELHDIAAAGEAAKRHCIRARRVRVGVPGRNGSEPAKHRSSALIPRRRDVGRDAVNRHGIRRRPVAVDAELQIGRGADAYYPRREQDDRLQRAVVDRHVIEEFAIDDRRVTR